MKVWRFAVLMAAALLSNGCIDSEARGPVGSTSGREKGTPSAMPATPAPGTAPAQGAAPAQGTTPAPTGQPKPAATGH